MNKKIGAKNVKSPLTAGTLFKKRIIDVKFRIYELQPVSVS
jgi:hypothetical protein